MLTALPSVEASAVAAATASSHRNRIDPPPIQINSPLQTMLIMIRFNPSHPSIPANRIITPRKSNRATRQSNRATTVENNAAPEIFHPTLETGVTGKKRHGESVKRAKQINENEQREKREEVVVGSVLGIRTRLGKTIMTGGSRGNKNMTRFSQVWTTAVKQNENYGQDKTETKLAGTKT